MDKKLIKMLLEGYVLTTEITPMFFQGIYSRIVIFKNPDSSEINGAERGFILANGDLYVAKQIGTKVHDPEEDATPPNTVWPDIIHQDILKILVNNRILSGEEMNSEELCDEFMAIKVSQWEPQVIINPSDSLENNYESD